LNTSHLQVLPIWTTGKTSMKIITTILIHQRNMLEKVAVLFLQFYFRKSECILHLS